MCFIMEQLFYKISLLPIKPLQPECFVHSTHPPHRLFSTQLTCPSSLFQPLLISPLLTLNTQLVLHSNTIKNVQYEARDFKHLDGECQREENCMDVILKRSSISRKSSESMLTKGEFAKQTACWPLQPLLEFVILLLSRTHLTMRD